MFQDEGQEVTACLDHSDKQGGRKKQSLMCILSSSVASGYKYFFILLQPKNLLVKLLAKTKFLLTYFHFKLESNIDFLSLYHQKLDCEKQLHVHQTYFRSSNERWLCRLDPRCQRLQIGEKKHWFSY